MHIVVPPSTPSIPITDQLTFTVKENKAQKGYNTAVVVVASGNQKLNFLTLSIVLCPRN